MLAEPSRRLSAHELQDVRSCSHRVSQAKVKKRSKARSKRGSGVALYEFGSFVLDAPERRLTRQGERVAVTGKTLDVLRLLVEAQGRLVDRQTFNAQLWPEVIVEDRNLTVHISALRKALGGDCIETVAKNGYRLAVPIRVVNGRAVNGQASSESLQVQREARYQLSQAERVPALKALGLFERALAIDANDAECAGGTRLDLSAAVVDDNSPAAAGRRGGAACNRSRAARAGDRQSSGRSLRRARSPEDDL